MKKNLCTLFDINYLPLGLALHSSIIKFFDDYHLWILALDDKCLKNLLSLNLPNTTIIGLNELEDQSVLVAKSNRTWQEYCWTLSPVLPYFVLEKNPDIDHITYLDSDIFFYNSPEEIYSEIGSSSIMVIPHRFPDRNKHYEENGIFNVQMVYFKRNDEGMKCLRRWRTQCIDWCYYKNEPGRFGDQKYLDEWPVLYENVCVLKNIGAGVALWNSEQYNLKKKNKSWIVNDKKLIFYHFHQYKYFRSGFYTANFHNYMLTEEFNPVYQIYTKEISNQLARYKILMSFTGWKDIFRYYQENPSFYHYNPIVDMFFKITLRLIHKLPQNHFINRIIIKIFKLK